MKPVQVTADVRAGIQMYGDLSDSNIFFFSKKYILSTYFVPGTL